MNYTNLNIKSNGKTFKYIVEYFDDPNSSSEELQCIKDKLFGYFFLMPNENNLSYQKNYYTEWDNISSVQKQYINSYIPKVFNISSLTALLRNALTVASSIHSPTVSIPERSAPVTIEV